MIVCCGEALIDMIPHSLATPLPSSNQGFVPHPGGAIFNTAIGLGRLGIKTAMCSGISEDVFGKILTEALHDSNVNSSTLIKSARPTTLAFVHLTNGHANYTFYDENSAGSMITQADLPAMPDNASTLYFGGISLCAEPAANAYQALAIREAKSRVIMLDPNIRTSFISDEQRYRSRLESMIAIADIIKVSDEDLSWIFQDKAGLTSKLERLQAINNATVIMTRGSKGPLALTAQNEEVTISVPKVEVVDTVGAGDTFNAGLLAKLSSLNLLDKKSLSKISTDQLHQALDFASQVAAITVTRSGANLPWASELQKTH